VCRVLLDWIDGLLNPDCNPKSESDFGFGLSIQFCHFNPNPKLHNYFIKKIHCTSHHAPTIRPSYFLSKFSKKLIISKVAS